jgi:hypothetical protein
MVSKREVVPQDERSSESCLHCEINEAAAVVSLFGCVKPSVSFRCKTKT